MTWRANVKRDGTVRSKVDLKTFGLVDETTFDDVRAWRLADTGLNLVADRGRLSWQMRPQGRVRKGRFSLRHSPNAKGTFCGRPLSPRGLTEMEVGEFDCKTLVLDATAPITLTELSFFGEGDCSVEVVGVEMDTSYGRTDYRRQFAFDSEEAAQAGEKGHVARKRVVRKVLLPGCGGKLMVEAKAFAHKSYAGSVKMWLSLDGETPLAEADIVIRPADGEAPDLDTEGKTKISFESLLREGRSKKIEELVKSIRQNVQEMIETAQEAASAA